MEKEQIKTEIEAIITHGEKATKADFSKSNLDINQQLAEGDMLTAGTLCEVVAMLKALNESFPAVEKEIAAIIQKIEYVDSYYKDSEFIKDEVNRQLLLEIKERLKKLK